MALDEDNCGSVVKFTLDGQSTEARDSETIWQVAKRLGVQIPHLCWKDAPGYRADGNCRACMVEIEGERTLAASCIRKPIPGMKVSTSNHRVNKNRKMVFELLEADMPAREESPDPEAYFGGKLSWLEQKQRIESRVQDLVRAKESQLIVFFMILLIHQ